MNQLHVANPPSTEPKTQMRTIDLEPSWHNVLNDEFSKPYMAKLRDFLVREKQIGKVIYPRGKEYFQAFNATPFDKVRVVILGQDPYHGPGQAHGLCFSVRHGVRPPPSLENIFRELSDDLHIAHPTTGELSKWAAQGVLLLNSVLTVEKGRAGSHQGKGWELFTDRVIELLNEKRDGLVFLLWGSYAIKKGSLVDRKRHLVLTAPHPSPLSAYRGFLGCRHFSQTNEFLAARHGVAIDWNLP